MGDPHFSGGWFFICVALIPLAAVLAALTGLWARREEAQGLVKLAAAVLIGPWILLLLNGWGAPVVAMLFPTSWSAPAVGMGLAIVSWKIRRKERHFSRRSEAEPR
jgi:hypothetical protein